MKTVTSIVYTRINILTKFHTDWMKTATSIVYTSDLINILTKFHKDWMKTVTSTVYTNKLLTDTRTYGRGTSHGHISSPCHFVTGSLDSPSKINHVFQANIIIFELKNAPPPGGHVFQPKGIIF
ncbi:hypothetical protein DPMN_000685 [Dreissena polymorpha]|uniref:Uncharacterized protein n=1 Tax=Dreissena polymorpha TaxID=45954 RepID=A0A9D4MIM9_DREPO|nr:hypothetical protein DPMN_000685 [Dreissena polymorpha]